MEPPKLIFSKFGDKANQPPKEVTPVETESLDTEVKTPEVKPVESREKVVIEKPKEFKYRVLVVDDEKALSRVLKLKLNSLGVYVDTAANGLEALEFLKSNKYNLIVLDIVMPEMGGFEVLDELKKQGKKLNILVATSLSQPEDREKAISYGVEYINKGSTPLAKMVTTIFELISKNGSK